VTAHGHAEKEDVMNTQHTPLYWKEGMIYNEEGQTLATMDSENKSLGMLIAAAPELLEACKAALIYCQSDPAVFPLNEKLRAAIAKAEGGGMT